MMESATRAYFLTVTRFRITQLDSRTPSPISQLQDGGKDRRWVSQPDAAGCAAAAQPDSHTHCRWSGRGSSAAASQQGQQATHSQLSNRHIGPNQAVVANLGARVDNDVALCEQWTVGKPVRSCGREARAAVTFSPDYVRSQDTQAETQAESAPPPTVMCGPSASCSGTRRRTDSRCSPRPVHQEGRGWE